MVALQALNEWAITLANDTELHERRMESLHKVKALHPYVLRLLYTFLFLNSTVLLRPKSTSAARANICSSLSTLLFESQEN